MTIVYATRVGCAMICALLSGIAGYAIGNTIVSRNKCHHCHSCKGIRFRNLTKEPVDVIQSVTYEKELTVDKGTGKLLKSEQGDPISTMYTIIARDNDE